ncbi:hypothetical protein CBR_g19092 [Chara braunii]|uniref:Alpha/beta hydrolase fold-5 domain-containing protein n=1 Tax=Chara braunii TaxID=69332 RepID=A0A388KXB3_CHABU|nr:hypothetical protein CBR_g19092 [Chara braunii]|eukprot:GBG74685.1 hypothetical protein CBR_g19092 [Chara braunii]
MQLDLTSTLSSSSSSSSSSSFSSFVSWPWPWGYKCSATAVAEAAMRPICPPPASGTSPFLSLTVTNLAGIGYVFVNATDCTINSREGSFEKIIKASGGVIIIPEKDVDPIAYAPYAQAIAKDGNFAAILTAEDAAAYGVIDTMAMFPIPQVWALMGHGVSGGQTAAKLTRALFPRVSTLILHASVLPSGVDFSQDNLDVVVNYGKKDLMVTPEMVEASFPRLPGHVSVNLLNKSHYDFAFTTCQYKVESKQPATVLSYAPLIYGDHHGGDGEEGEQMQVVAADKHDYRPFLSLSIEDRLLLGQCVSPMWRAGRGKFLAATPRALSFGDNHLLTPGHKGSKVYPVDGVVVQVETLPQPETSPSPARSMIVVKPNVTKGGYVYYPGGFVDSRAYLPLAFQIAARGYMVVIPEFPRRSGVFLDSILIADQIIRSNYTILQSVPQDKWAVGGHSLGAVAAFNYAGFSPRHPIQAVVMHAGQWGGLPMMKPPNLTQSALPVANIYGSLDGMTGPKDPDDFYANSALHPLVVNITATKFLPVEGANHYQIGDYGYQFPDRIATIGQAEQEQILGQLTAEFLNKAMGYNN